VCVCRKHAHCPMQSRVCICVWTWLVTSWSGDDVPGAIMTVSRRTFSRYMGSWVCEVRVDNGAAPNLKRAFHKGSVSSVEPPTLHLLRLVLSGTYNHVQSLYCINTTFK
jgi:hypothetical protein